MLFVCLQRIFIDIVRGVETLLSGQSDQDTNLK